ncbi:MAG: hybrid sensor histidine kinase/response regulator [Bacteroidota bacterium]
MKKILVIDDAEFILESTSTLLRFEGYEVFTAPDGLAGVEEAFKTKPDLILCDISMPGLDGYGVLEKIRSNNITATIPFIFLTAFTEKSNMRAGMEKGADDFLVKPYTRDELIAAIDAQWRKHSFIERQVQEKVEEVGRNVTYALPHEFRTVLNQVVGSAKYLNSNSKDISADEIEELSQDIISSSKRLMRITENFLIYIRIESFAANPEKRIQLKQHRTDEPGAMIVDLASIIGEKYDRFQDVDITSDVESISLTISTESFHKVIDEVIDNAFKFSEKGTPVNLQLWLEGELLYISVKDEGRGMSKEQIANVGAYIQFERTIYEQQGVGLGLVIAKRLVELHDGSFRIESDGESFTQVTFSLPFVKMPLH